MLIEEVAKSALVFVAGCPRTMAEIAMRDTLIEWCTDTRCLVAMIDVTFRGCSAEVQNAGEMSRQIIDVLDASIAGEQIKVTPRNGEAVDELLDTDGETVLRVVSESTLQLTPAATAAAPVRVDILAVIAPGPASRGMPDNVWRAHSEALRNGALERLFAMPQKAWSNPQLAAYHGDRFRAAKKDALATYHRNVTMPARRLRVRPA